MKADEQISGALSKVKKCNAEAENMKSETVHAVLLDLPTSKLIAMASNMTQVAPKANVMKGLMSLVAKSHSLNAVAVIPAKLHVFSGF